MKHSADALAKIPGNVILGYNGGIPRLAAVKISVTTALHLTRVTTLRTSVSVHDFIIVMSQERFGVVNNVNVCVMLP